ncbi:MAG: GUN4 domain-containing protein [Limnospira sp.]
MSWNYRRLQQRLAAHNWKEADLETRRLMLAIAEADRREEQLLTQHDLDNFSCKALKNIDKLWRAYSQGRFGFTVVYKLYRQAGGDYSKLAEMVGWREGDKWLVYDELNFTIDAPPGHLPVAWLVPVKFDIYWSTRFAGPAWRLLLTRIQKCFYTQNR